MDSNAKENGQPVPPRVDLRKQVGQPHQGAPGTDKNVQTTHIELPDNERRNQMPAAAKATVVVKPMSADPRADGRMHTMQIDTDDLMAGAGASAAPPAPMPSPTVSVKPIGVPSSSGAPAAKRETSRIPLEMAKPSMGAPGRPSLGPSTIRVKPVVIRQTVDLAQAAPDGTGGAAQTLPPVSPESGKRKTSRISLESVLGSQAGVASQTAEISAPETDDEPRTIRIKRTAERPATNVAVAAPMSSGQTARLELPPDTPAVAPGGAGGPSPTRKKTIKMRRPGEEDGDRESAPVTVARPEPVVQSSEDVPHATFGVLALVASLVMAVLVWILMAQAFGRDVSLTKLSYGWPDCPASWPGQIPPSR
jgi:hypothetical protein